MKNISWLIVILALGSTACGTQWSGNYAGNWSGTYNSSPLTNTTFAMTLYQTGSNVNGYWLATGSTGSQPSSGQIQGTVSGNTLTTNFIVPTGETIPATGTYAGTLTLNSNTLTGTVTGGASGASLTATVTASQTR